MSRRLMLDTDIFSYVVNDRYARGRPAQAGPPPGRRHFLTTTFAPAAEAEE